MPNLESIKLPIKSNGTVTNTKYDIPQGDVMESELDQLLADYAKSDDVDEALATKADKSELGLKADAIVETASGAIASFDDGGDDIPLKSLVVNIEPKQSGTGDPSPSNVRPISGWDDVEVVRCGKNLWNPHLYTGMRYNPTVGSTIEFVDSNRQLTEISEGVFTITYTPTWEHNVMVIPISKDSHFAIDGTISSTGTLGVSYVYLDENFKVLRVNNNTDATQDIRIELYPENNLTTDKGYYAIIITNRDTANATLTITKPNCEKGDTHTDYEPYISQSYPISLPSTVYGGTLDVVSGVLTLDHKLITFDGSSDETLAWVYNQIRATISDSNINGIPSAQLKCNRLKPLDSRGGSWDSLSYSLGTYNSSNDKTFVFIIGTGATSLEEGKAWLASNSVEVWYPLAEPITIQLTPTQVNTLLGDNNIWADAGTVNVEYRADTTLAYNKLLARIEALES